LSFALVRKHVKLDGMVWLFRSLSGTCTAAIAILQFKPSVIDNPYGRLIVIALALIAVACLVVSSVFDRNEATKRDNLEHDTRQFLSDTNARVLAMTKQQQESDRHYQELFALIPKPPPIPAPLEIEPVTLPDIRDMVRDLAHDLFAFLKEIGPGPKMTPEEGATKETRRESMARVWRELGPWVTAIHNGYDSRFRVRLENLMQELRAKEITDTGIEPWEINPPNGQNDERIRGIAEKLYILAAKMDIQKMGDEPQ
jgi:hypothetical protein